MTITEHEIAEKLNVVPPESDRPKVPLYVALARAIGAHERSLNAKNQRWADRWEFTIGHFAEVNLPSGSGFDGGSRVEFGSSEDQIIIATKFHHMDENGYYTKWTDHNVIVTPSLAHGFKLKVTGRDYNQIKEYIADTFHYALNTLVDEFPKIDE